MLLEPKFLSGSYLLRYIKENYRGKKGPRPLIPAYLPEKWEDYLSVNSLEIEKEAEIVSYYRKKFPTLDGKISYHKRKVSNYTGLGVVLNINIKYSISERCWMFSSPEKSGKCFKHRPITQKRGSGKPESPSHCGVEFLDGTKIKDLHKLTQAARRLINKPNYHLV